MKNHTVLVHDGSKPFACQYCEKKFGILSEVKRHIDSKHRKECQKVQLWSMQYIFVGGPGQLREHINIVHEKRKDYKCNISQKEFEDGRKLKETNENFLNFCENN